MRETDELLPTTTARIVHAPKARPRALALTLAVALCAASAIAGVAIPRWQAYWSAYNGLVPAKMKDSWETWVYVGL